MRRRRSKAARGDETDETYIGGLEKNKHSRTKKPYEDVLRHIGRIWNHLKERSGPGLSKDTHGKDSPWHMAMNPPRDFFQRLTGWKPARPVIEDALIRRFCWEFGPLEIREA